jgi:hypothetical protein
LLDALPVAGQSTNNDQACCVVLAWPEATLGHRKHSVQTWRLVQLTTATIMEGVPEWAIPAQQQQQQQQPQYLQPPGAPYQQQQQQQIPSQHQPPQYYQQQQQQQQLQQVPFGAQPPNQQLIPHHPPSTAGGYGSGAPPPQPPQQQQRPAQHVTPPPSGNNTRALSVPREVVTPKTKMSRIAMMESKVLVTRTADEETEDGRIRNNEAIAKIRDAWVYKQIRERVDEFTDYKQVRQWSAA